MPRPSPLIDDQESLTLRNLIAGRLSPWAMIGLFTFLLVFGLGGTLLALRITTDETIALPLNSVTIGSVGIMWGVALFYFMRLCKAVKKSKKIGSAFLILLGFCEIFASLFMTYQTFYYIPIRDLEDQRRFLGLVVKMINLNAPQPINDFIMRDNVSLKQKTLYFYYTFEEREHFPNIVNVREAFQGETCYYLKMLSKNNALVSAVHIFTSSKKHFSIIYTMNDCANFRVQEGGG